MGETKFRLGINMAGAISAGAYTAGVFDFLIEALDAWQRAKDAGEAVPMHEVSIEVLSGASAGGMCAAIAASALYDRPGGKPGKFYRAWVEEIDINLLIGQSDLKGKEVRSLLNSEPIEKIARQTLIVESPAGRPFVSRHLNLFLTVTNLRGVPYGVNFAQNAAFEEHTDYYSDQIQFEVSDGTGKAKHVPERYHLRLNEPGGKPWKALQRAAVATGAVPVMLAPQRLEREAADYEDRKWQVSNTEPCKDPGDGMPPTDKDCGCWCEKDVKICPAWDSPKEPFENVYVDGGVTNNNPFECARLFLARQGGSMHNERSPGLADAAVITIAPFPGSDRFTSTWSVEEHLTLLGALGSLKDVLVNQSRFTGESLSLLKDPDVASRFVIAPDDDLYCADTGVPALQCGSLGAFGGFLSRSFRDRDYLLGRRNCQYFLKTWFVLPQDNPLIQRGLEKDPKGLIERFEVKDKKHPREGGPWMPIIPLCTQALQDEVKNPGRVQMDVRELDAILKKGRLRLRSILRKLAPSGAPAFVARVFGGVVAKRLIAKARPGIVKDLKNAKGLDDRVA